MLKFLKLEIILMPIIPIILGEWMNLINNSNKYNNNNIKPKKMKMN